MNPHQPPSAEAVKAAFEYIDMMTNGPFVLDAAVELRRRMDNFHESGVGYDLKLAARILAAHARALHEHLKVCLHEIPMVNQGLHTVENLPSLIAGTVSEHVESWNENERLREALERIKDHDCDQDDRSIVSDLTNIAYEAISGKDSHLDASRKRIDKALTGEASA